jgi:hypothetical protein
MVINDKFIFVHMVKTGGTFLQDYFGKNIAGCRSTGSGAGRHKPVKAIKDLPQFKFGVMRNPYAWYISWWAFQAIQRSPGNSLPTLLVADFSQSIRNLDQARGIIKQTKSHLFIDFDIMHRFDIGVMTYKFIEMFCDADRIFSQNVFDGFKREDLLIDATVTMEDLRNEVVEIFYDYIFTLSEDQVNNLYDHPRINVGKYEDFTEHYTPETVEWVKRKDRHLFNLYPEYTFKKEV